MRNRFSLIIFLLVLLLAKNIFAQDASATPSETSVIGTTPDLGPTPEVSTTTEQKAIEAPQTSTPTTSATTTDITSTPQPIVEQKRETSSYYSDPFSEIESTEDEENEEALDRFYSFGRILHLSLFGEYAALTGPMTDIYKPGVIGGFRISYFIDWDVAVTFNFGLGKLNLSLLNKNTATSSLVDPITGTATIANIGIGLKYYLNFYDISKAIAYLNPAISAGVEMTIIRDQINQDILTLLGTRMNDPAHRTVAPGLFAGFSLEVPIFRKSIYLGADFIYHFSFFPSTNSVLSTTVTDPHFGWVDYSGRYITAGAYLIWNL
ncbi:MAG: hypothetical protein WCQ47_05800 [bacterium]